MPAAHGAEPAKIDACSTFRIKAAGGGLARRSPADRTPLVGAWQVPQNLRRQGLARQSVVSAGGPARGLSTRCLACPGARRTGVS